MDVQQHILDFLASKSGNSTYPELYEATEYRYRRELMSNLRALRKAGKVGQVIELTPEGNVHKLWLETGS